MSRLSKLYEAMETLRSEGLSLEQIEGQISELEEDIIKKEIVPVLTGNIEPALRQVRRELVLVVDYVPGRPLGVHISRKRNIAADLADAKLIVTDPVVEHSARGGNAAEGITRGSGSGLTVTFPDGSEIAGRKAVDTLEMFVRKVGVARVRKVVEERKLVFNKVPVISDRRDGKYGGSQRDLGGGWLLITHSNNEMKKKFIEKVSDALGLGVVVRLVK